MNALFSLQPKNVIELLRQPSANIADGGNFVEGRRLVRGLFSTTGRAEQYSPRLHLTARLTLQAVSRLNQFLKVDIAPPAYHLRAT
jgi:hypothetical protein